MGIIDIECDIPTREVYESLLDQLRQGKMSAGMINYLEIFGSQWLKSTGITDDELEQIQKTEGMDGVYERIINGFIDGAISEEQFVEMLEEAGVNQACIGTGWFASIEHTAALAGRFPERFIPWLRISPFEKMPGVKKLEGYIREYGFKGFEVSPFRENIYVNDKKYYPYYAKCVELGIPVRAHTSMNYDLERSMDLGRPLYLDEVARDFPELTIIAGLGGWPWTAELVGLARRHRNLYIDLAAHRPKHISTPGSGFEMLLQFGNTLLQDRILFASSWMTLGLPIKQIIEEMDTLPLKESVKQKWMHDNAARILNS